MLRRPAVALIAGLLALPAAPLAAAELLGSHTWNPGWHGAGGYSALEVEPDGAGFTVLSDRGGWVRGRLDRDRSGAVRTVRVAARGTLAFGATDRAAGWLMDPEGLAITPAGAFVAFESPGRVERYADLAAAPDLLPTHPDFARLPSNAALEALAADGAGRLYAIPEGGRGDAFPVYVFEHGAWSQPFALRRDRRFRPTGADIGPDGRLYVLERDFAIIGFRSRVRSWAPDGTDERTELRSRLRAHDNLEGLAVWRDADGRMRATMVSDDNLRSIQVTEFVDYALGEGS